MNWFQGACTCATAANHLSLDSSIDILETLSPLSLNSEYHFFSSGLSTLHGTHQLAQKTYIFNFATVINYSLQSPFTTNQKNILSGYI
jgi:hypothetical protein